METPLPPDDPELKNIIDKLAYFVAKNGPEFEYMTREKQKSNPQFSFLEGGDYYDYYIYQVESEKSNMMGGMDPQQYQMGMHQQPPFPGGMHQPMGEEPRTNIPSLMSLNLNASGYGDNSAPVGGGGGGWGPGSEPPTSKSGSRWTEGGPPEEQRGGSRWGPAAGGGSSQRSGCQGSRWGTPPPQSGSGSDSEGAGGSRWGPPAASSGGETFPPWRPPPLTSGGPTGGPGPRGMMSGQPSQSHVDTIKELCTLQSQLQEAESQLAQQQQQTDVEVSQSEGNLTAQYASLMAQQTIQIEEGIATARHDAVRSKADQLGVAMDEMDQMIQSLIESCTKDNIGRGKSWIIEKAKSDEMAALTADYLLSRVAARHVSFDLRLHIVYLINDLLHHCKRRGAQQLQGALQSIVVPIFSLSAELADEERRAKLDKVLSLWETNSYLPKDLLQKMRDPFNFLVTWKTEQSKSFPEVARGIGERIQAHYLGLQQQHAEFVAHSRGQTLQAQQRVDQLKQQIQQMQQQQMPSQPPTSGPPPWGMGGPPGFPADGPPADSSYGPPQRPPFGLPILPDLSQPPPGFERLPPRSHAPSVPSGPPHRAPMSGSDMALVPTTPYYETPAALMVSLIPLSEFEYRPMRCDDLRLPPPMPPSERLLAAVEAFYTAPSHERPRDSDGWERLGLYEFFKAKERAKKEPEFDYRNAYFGLPSEAKDQGPESGPGGQYSPPRSRSRDYQPPPRALPPNMPPMRPGGGGFPPPQQQGSGFGYGGPPPMGGGMRGPMGMGGPNFPPMGMGGGDRPSLLGREPGARPERRRPVRRYSRSRSRSRSYSRSRSRSRSPSRSSRSRSRSRSPDSSRSRSTSPPLRFTSAPGPGAPPLAPAGGGRLAPDNKGMQMMQRMGWSGSRGLGSREQGRMDPVGSDLEPRERSEQFRGVGSGSGGADAFDQFRKRKSQGFSHMMRSRAEDRQPNQQD